MESTKTLAALLALGLLVTFGSTGQAGLADAPGFVSPGEISGYSLLYAVDNNSFDFNDAYTIDNSASFAIGSFGRVGYFLQLDSDWVWAAMDTFDTDPNLVGVPRAGTGIVENGTVVNNLNVEASGPIITSTGTGQTGIIEFWASNYNANGGGAFGSNNSLFDWKDSGGSTGGGYGSFQVSAFTNAGLTDAENLFAVHVGGNSGGIGDNPGTHPDWTFQNNSFTSNAVRNLEIWVKPPTSAGADLFWDGDTGNWTTADWLNDVPGTGANQSTYPQNMADVVNPANITEGTVTVSSNEEAFSLTMDDGSTNGSGDRPGTGILNITSNTLSINTDATISNTSAVNISSGATLDVTGTLTIDSTNLLALNNSGIVNAGSLAGSGTATLNAASKLKAGNGTLGAIALTGSAEVEVGGTVTITTLTTPGTSSTFTKSGIGTLDVTGNLGLNGDTYTPTAGTLRFSGVVSDGTDTSLTKGGNGTLELANNNDYTGATAVTAGILHITNGGALGDSGADTTVGSSAQLRLSNNIIVAAGEAISINGASNGGAIYNLSGNNEIDGPVTLAGNATVRVDNNRLRLDGGVNLGTSQLLAEVDGNQTLEIRENPITGSGNLRKQGDGTLNIRVASPGFSGLTIANNGRIDVNVSDGLGTGLVRPEGDGTVRISNNITLQNNFDLRTDGEGTDGAIRNESGTNTITGTVTSNNNNSRIRVQGGQLNLSPTSGAALDLNNNLRIDGDGTLNITGQVTDGGTISKFDNGTTILSNGTNDFTGTMNVNDGLVRATASGALGSPSAINVASGATLELANTGSSSAPISIGGTGHSSAGVIDNVAGDNSFSGPLSINSSSTINADAGSSVTFSGPVTLDLNADVTFSGNGNFQIDQAFGNGFASTSFNALDGFAFDVNGRNGDTTLGNIGSPGSLPSLLDPANPPKDQILISGTDRIDYRNDNDFNNGNAGNQAQGFPNLNQNNNFATMFSGQLNVPDLLGGGTPYDVELGTNRGDDPVQIYLDLDQDNVFEHGQGANFNPGGVSGPFDEMILNRDCCGNGFRTITLAPGTYDYAAVQLERGGGSSIEPTIDLTPDALGRRTLQPGQMAGLFTVTLTPDNNLVKDGTGIARLNGDNTYGGTTDVNDGTLIVNGTTSDQESYNVAATATLGGNGNIGLRTGFSVVADGIISPGDRGDFIDDPTYSMGMDSSTVGTIQFTAGSALDTALELNGTLQIDLFDSTTFDTAQALAGIIDIDPGSILEINGLQDMSMVDWLGLGFTGGDQIALLTAPDGINGGFSNLPLTPIEISEDLVLEFQYTSGTFSLSFFSPFVAVPEPATVLIALLGLLGMGWLGWCRRKRA